MRLYVAAHDPRTLELAGEIGLRPEGVEFAILLSRVSAVAASTEGDVLWGNC